MLCFYHVQQVRGTQITGKMAPKIKLVYFNMEGRAELTRLILAQAGVEFEDKRVTREEWMAMKPSKLRSKSQG